jgi:hypothetical protein
MEARLPLHVSKVVSPASPSLPVWSVRQGAATRGPSLATACSVFLITLLGFVVLSGGIIRLRESEKRARAGEALKALSRSNDAVLALIRSDLQASPAPGLTVADEAGVRIPEEGVPYHNLTIRTGGGGHNRAMRRILYAFLASGEEPGDGRDNDHDGMTDEGLLLRWDERSGPRIIARDLLDVAFIRHGTELEVKVCAAAKQYEAPPLVHCATVNIDLMAP